MGRLAPDQSESGSSQDGRGPPGWCWVVSSIRCWWTRPRGPPGVADLTPPNSPTTPPSRAQAVHSGLWTTWAQGLHLCSHRLGNECFWGWSVSH